MQPVILWFRRDLRLTDNQAFAEAALSGRPIIPVYIVDDQDVGGAKRWWLHHSLHRLDHRLHEIGGTLLLRTGRPEEVLPKLAEETRATTVYFSRRYEPASLAQESRLEAALEGIALSEAFDDSLLNAPATVATQSSSPYRVFTPFWKAALRLGEPSLPKPVPASTVFSDQGLHSIPLSELQLLPAKYNWSGGLGETWQPGETGALERLDALHESLSRYHVDRDYPGTDGTSRLSPHLHFGEISVRQVWHTIRQLEYEQPDGGEALRRQLYWRDFCAHLLFHFPNMVDTPLRSEFENFPWSDNEEHLGAWQRGETGYPIVDAGMRQLWQTGWMHNRVRMIAASFLVKDLMIPWQRGAEWFLDTLVDADMANNAAGWQWVAGCGTDAAPYFRIFNPERQAEKFDSDHSYVRRWIPELAGGKSYPQPIVDHRQARERALSAYSLIKGTRTSSRAPGSSESSSVISPP